MQAELSRFEYSVSGIKTRDVRRRHAISPVFADHHQDLGMSKPEKWHDSAGNLILSVETAGRGRAHQPPTPASPSALLLPSGACCTRIGFSGVSLLFTALYAKCPYYLGLYMHSVLII